MRRLIEKIHRWLDPSPEEILAGIQLYEVVRGRPFFPGTNNFYTRRVKEQGTPIREFRTTRHDN